MDKNHFQRLNCHKPYFNQLDCCHEQERAIFNAKTSRIFAKPLISVLEHTDAVTCITQSDKDHNIIISGSSDGKIHEWEVESGKCMKELIEHCRPITGIASTHVSKSFVSCASDKQAYLWIISDKTSAMECFENHNFEKVPFWGRYSFTGIDHHWTRPYFVTIGSITEVWEHSRKKPLRSYTWEPDTSISVRFNSVERDVFAVCSADCSIFFYDLRMSIPIQKLILSMRPNAIAWSPIEALRLTTANEDSNLYTFDMRNLKSALLVHQDFVSSVLDVDYSPNGNEFVAGSFDRSIRIFGDKMGHSREIYHTVRMQRVIAVKFSLDGNLVFSGSDDMNLRIWKSKASKKKTIYARQRHNQGYNSALTTRYYQLENLKTILKNRFVPEPIFHLSILKRQGERKKSVF